MQKEMKSTKKSRIALLAPFLLACGGDTFVYPNDAADPPDSPLATHLDGGSDVCIPAMSDCRDARADATDGGTLEAEASAPAPIATVCGKVNTAGIFCNAQDCSGNVAAFADAYCKLAGFSKAASYETLDSGMVQCLYFDAGLAAPSNCTEVHYGSGLFYLSSQCEAIDKLECQ